MPRGSTGLQARGGLLPGSQPQEWCDVCTFAITPSDRVELTLTTPSRVVRVYAHPKCAPRLPNLTGITSLLQAEARQPEEGTPEDKMRRMCEARVAPGSGGAEECDHHAV